MAAARAVTKRCYNFVSSQKLSELRQEKLKRKTKFKMNWGVTAYNEWCEARLQHLGFDHGIFHADLTKLETLTKENFIYAMCYFIPEVTKKKTNDLYPGPTLYQLCAAI